MPMGHSVSTSTPFQVVEAPKEADGVTYHIEKQNFTYRFIKPYTENQPTYLVQTRTVAKQPSTRDGDGSASWVDVEQNRGVVITNQIVGYTAVATIHNLQTGQIISWFDQK